MKPVGRKRDIEVAKLKGIKIYIDPYNVGDNDDIYYIPSGKLWRTHEIDARMLPRYSTTSDCWILWDELPTPKSITEYQGKYCMEYRPNLREDEIETCGNSFPDAVSQAWIKWKEATK